jgi:hypothetical protein
MKNRLAGYSKKVFSFLGRKKELSFLNAAAILLLSGAIIISFRDKEGIQDTLIKKAFLNTKVSRDLTYIKPFTSLAGFNWKFSKDSKRRSKETKTSLTLPLIHYKISF